MITVQSATNIHSDRSRVLLNASANVLRMSFLVAYKHIIYADQNWQIALNAQYTNSNYKCRLSTVYCVLYKTHVCRHCASWSIYYCIHLLHLPCIPSGTITVCVYVGMPYLCTTVPAVRPRVTAVLNSFAACSLSLTTPSNTSPSTSLNISTGTKI